MKHPTAALAPLYCFLLSTVVWGFSSVPPVRRSNVPTDENGANCTLCHRGTALNGDARGSVSIEMNDTYMPGAPQTIRVRVRHPEAVRWGFQMTARQTSDTSKKAGTFEAGGGVALRCATTATAPCGDETEFVSHNGAPQGDTGAGFVFEVRWTPPASEVGEITFFAVGNAANGSNTNVGDFIYSTTKRVTLDPSAACTNPRPVLSRIVNGASFQPGTAPGALSTILGSALQQPGRTRIVGAGDIVNRAFPRELGCLAVEVNGARVPLLYAQQDQVNFQMPTNLTSGPASVVVIANPGRPNEIRSDQGQATVTSTQPAWFVFRDGSGPLSIAATSADGREIIANPAVIAGARPARPGETITLYATGLGATNPESTAGDIPTDLTRIAGAATVTVGGTVLAGADVTYAGLVPNSINGLYQVNVKLPDSQADGDVPVVIAIGGNASQTGVGTGAVVPVRRPTPAP